MDECPSTLVGIVTAKPLLAIDGGCGEARVRNGFHEVRICDFLLRYPVTRSLSIATDLHLQPSLRLSSTKEYEHENQDEYERRPRHCLKSGSHGCPSHPRFASDPLTISAPLQ